MSTSSKSRFVSAAPLARESTARAYASSVSIFAIAASHARSGPFAYGKGRDSCRASALEPLAVSARQPFAAICGLAPHVALGCSSVRTTRVSVRASSCRSTSSRSSRTKASSSACTTQATRGHAASAARIQPNTFVKKCQPSRTSSRRCKSPYVRASRDSAPRTAEAPAEVPPISVAESTNRTATAIGGDVLPRPAPRRSGRAQVERIIALRSK
eukprot:3348566-Pleurochrysis_carterae.AAC.2